ncbi:bifunctional ADP-dependent NAD(P)H-hydrate dehydratase/NAD(P)H-hydrate epimerase, partial [Francisella tularensis subsp. holarctica]|nr:bifunctional ADP-dependent NAD(P)H-hydrate dehydratase/NAD(P)H-hydrate epimerase [Francisella tularensis subsp. holarctica]
IGAFLAQVLDIISASRLAVYIHGLDGDILAKKLGGYIGIFTSGVAEEVCEVLNIFIYKLCYTHKFSLQSNNYY